MRQVLWLMGFCLFSTQLFAEPIAARLIRTVSTAAPVRQVAATADGQRIYVLTETGIVQLFGHDGQPQGSFDAGPGVNGIVAQGADRLILQMKDQQQVLLVALAPIAQLTVEAAPILGPAGAPVTITLFDDFECPYCAQAAPIIKDVLAAYPDQVKLVFKNFPLKMHKQARLAAMAGLAAHRQRQFWPLHDLMFDNYRELSPEKIKQLAQQLGLDMDRFEEDLRDPALARHIESDIREGKKNGVRGTPTLFINGRRVQQRTAAAMSGMIAEELKRLEQQEEK